MIIGCLFPIPLSAIAGSKLARLRIDRSGRRVVHFEQPLACTPVKFFTPFWIGRRRWVESAKPRKILRDIRIIVKKLAEVRRRVHFSQFRRTRRNSQFELAKGCFFVEL